METNLQRHMQLVEQNLTKEVFDNISITEPIAYPAVILTSDRAFSKAEFISLKKLIPIYQGDHTLYVKMGNKLIKVGFIEKDIDIISRLGSIFSEGRLYLVTEEKTVTELTLDILLNDMKIK